MLEYTAIPTNELEQARENREMEHLNRRIQQNVTARQITQQEAAIARQEAELRIQRAIANVTGSIAIMAAVVILGNIGAIAEWISMVGLMAGFGNICFQMGRA